MQSKTLTIPKSSTPEIQTVGDKQYLVAELPEVTRTCSQFQEDLQKNRSVIIPLSKRGYFIHSLKKQKIFTKSRIVVPGKFCQFDLCAEREFRD